MARLHLQQIGSTCLNEDCQTPGRRLLHPDEDPGVQRVLGVLSGLPVAENFTTAVCASVDYVLDGRRTGRFDLLAPDVHPGERASVGAKLEYEALRIFRWKKAKPLDTVVGGVPVDLKATVGANWAIPTEAHCHLCLCTQIRVGAGLHRTWLIRAHTSWLYRGKGNKDGKRGIAVEARERWGVPLYDWTPLPVNPLSLLTEEQAGQVLADRPGQQVRLLKMFGYLPGVVIPRNAIETVCAGRQDPVRRVRNIRLAAERKGLRLLCGTWLEDRMQAELRGIALGPGDWIALPLEGDVADPAQRGIDQAWPVSGSAPLWEVVHDR
ncbi:hypothetical protein LO771_28235 [Streptacidiphilus sp. ASG 303]|uniref:NaeI family type II restriction endonuclease n=1 Tax=Streptacidiphilus sp. ASG 303 TaxID=2896847 RepID=UPI001E61719A|nr:NaeI family type II restriction endonuclease [Streptacidiphilus sp. ASG 303]MCD0486167.1 hypothetical protein [Streptacidiphilus sp. ASG 303]